MPNLRYKEIRKDAINPTQLHEAVGELSRLGAKGFLSAPAAKLFYAKRTLFKEGEKRTANVFLAIHPDIEEEMSEATGILAKYECEFPINIQSRAYSKMTGKNEEESHFAVIERRAPPLTPVFLESQGYEILDVHFLTFQQLLAEIVAGVPADAARRNLSNILALFKMDVLDRVGIAPSLVFDNRTVWFSNFAPGDVELDELVRIISKNGMVGPNFVNMPGQDLVEPVHFDFHGHPGYPERWLIPPSIGDIGSSYSKVTRKESKAELLIQALSLRLTEDGFGLFIRPYFRGEGWVSATADPVLTRAGYLDEVYNTTRERPVGEESYKLLATLASFSDALGQDPEIVAGILTLEKGVKEIPEQQNRLVELWNSIVSRINSLMDIIPRSGWRTLLWENSGGVIEL